MADFNLNEVEKENEKAVIDAIKVVYGEDINYKIQYLITHTGIGLNVELIVDSHKIGIPIRKDITDYDSW